VCVKKIAMWTCKTLKYDFMTDDGIELCLPINLNKFISSDIVLNGSLVITV
jgi:hypothetical protein